MSGSWAGRQKKKPLCKEGHDTLIWGRRPNGSCNGCHRVDIDSDAGKKMVRENNWKRRGILNEQGKPFLSKDYVRLFQIQDGRCALKTCNKHQSEFKKSLVVDHDHKTGIVRGLLCVVCNWYKVGDLTREEALAVAEYLTDGSNSSEVVSLGKEAVAVVVDVVVDVN
jgi:hypothetical protein